MARALAGPRPLAGPRALAGQRALRVLVPPAPGISVSPATWAAGSVQTAGATAVQVFTVTNPGTADLLMGTVAITGSATFTKSADGVSGATIAPSATAQVTVTFDPAVAGAVAAQLSFPSNVPGPLVIALTGTGVTTAGAVVAFPGAEGFGAGVTGGRGGTVLFVTNLNDSGPGSFRAACIASGARIVVFRVGGTILMSSALYISNPNITVAGQTAPGGGITLRGGPFIVNANNVIVRGIRVRNGTTSLTKSLWDGLQIYGPDGDSGGSYVDGVIIDHCSTSWAIDEVLGTYGLVRNVTFSWCIFSECLMNAQHDKGPHSMGALMGSYLDAISFHHNLGVHNNQRNGPRVQGNQPIEVINNVFYDWGEIGQQVDQGTITSGLAALKDPHENIISNYYKAGPNSTTTVCRLSGPFVGTQLIYVSGNISPNRTTLTQPEWDLITNSGSPTLQRFTPWPMSTHPVTVTPWPTFVADVYAGAGVLNRDSVDTRIIAEAQAGTGTIIDDPADVGGWPTLAAGTAPTDTNNDGVPDAWAAANGMGGASAGSTSPTGYTWIEDYINSFYPAGAPAAQNILTLSPGSWSAGAVDPAAGAVTQVFTVTNTGTVNVTVGTASVTGTGFAKGTDNASGQTLAPGASQTITVSFDPSAVGSFSGSLSVPSTATASPNTAALTGSGQVAAANPQFAIDLIAWEASLTVGQTFTVPTGTGWTDGSAAGAAFASWLSSKPQGTQTVLTKILFPSGFTWRMDGDQGLWVENLRGYLFSGYGATIQNWCNGTLSHRSSTWFLEGATYCVIEGFACVGEQGDNGILPAVGAVGDTSTAFCGGVAMRAGTQWLVVRDVVFTKQRSWVLYVDGEDGSGVNTNHIYVHDCTISGGALGIANVAGDQVFVDNCAFADQFWSGMDIEPDTARGIHEMLVQNCTWDRWGWAGHFDNWLAIGAGSAPSTVQEYDITIRRNHILRAHAISAKGTTINNGGTSTDKRRIKIYENWVEPISANETKTGASGQNRPVTWVGNIDSEFHDNYFPIDIGGSIFEAGELRLNTGIVITSPNFTNGERPPWDP